MTRSYETTSVPIAKSQSELRILLQKFGAQQFTFGEGVDWAGVEFVHADQLVRVRCPLRAPTVEQIRAQRKVSRLPEDRTVDLLANREAMRIWRVLVWTIKARLIAVEEGVETFESAFLSHLVDPASNRTVWEQVREPIEAGMLRLGGPGLKALAP